MKRLYRKIFRSDSLEDLVGLKSGYNENKVEVKRYVESLNEQTDSFAFGIGPARF